MRDRKRSIVCVVLGVGVVLLLAVFLAAWRLHNSVFSDRGSLDEGRTVGTAANKHNAGSSAVGRVQQAEGRQDRFGAADLLGRMLLEFVALNKRYPQSLSEIPDLPTGVREGYLYRAGGAQSVRPNEPVAMEKPGAFGEEAFVVYGDGHCARITGRDEIERLRATHFQ